MTALSSVPGAALPRIAELSTIAHDGKVVVVGCDFDGLLHYTIRQSGFEDTVTKIDAAAQQMPGFENWQELPLDMALPDESVATHEAISLIDKNDKPIMRSIYGKDAAPSAVGRVKLVSALGHLYVFRVSPSGRLLANRFVLDGMTNEIVPKLEVRYRRSGLKLLPDGGTGSRPGQPVNDSLGSKRIDEFPFCEPAQELTFLGKFDLDKPWFSVELIATAEHGKHRCLLYTSPSPRDATLSRMPSSA